MGGGQGLAGGPRTLLFPAQEVAALACARRPGKQVGQTASCRSQPGRSSGILNEQFPSLFFLQRWRLVDSGIRRFRHRIQHSQQSRGQNLPWVSSHPMPCLSGTSYFLFPQVWSFVASPALSQTGDGRIRPRPCPQEE